MPGDHSVHFSTITHVPTPASDHRSKESTSRRLVDSFDLWSEVGVGTCVIVEMWAL